MRQDWTGFATANVPRYTSYPTAAQFGDRVGVFDTLNWAGATPAETPISAYLHVPFCEALCWYCGCHTTVPNGYDRIARYVSTVHREIELWAEALGKHGGVGHLHFGGGSPNALSADDFLTLTEHIRTVLNVREGAEIAVELDPRSLTAERVSAMAAAGVNRASLGVQTLDPAVQKAVNRIQPRDMVETCVERLHEAGIKAINVDLMYGLPHQTISDVIDVAEYCGQYQISRVAVFGYAHVPWFAKHQRAIAEAALPGLKERARQADMAAKALMAQGYVRIGLDHFARPDDPLAIAQSEGRLRRNFQGYTDDPYETLIGIGPSSISAFRDGYAQNTRRSDHWREAIEAGRLPTDRGVGVDAEDRLRARAIEALMCTLRVDLDEVCSEMGAAFGALDGALAYMDDLAGAGICQIDGRSVRMPEAARMLVRNVAQAFDAYSVRDGQGKHAIAV